jgi:hypothetical protein
MQGPLLQPRVFRLGLLQDGDVGVGVFPEAEEVFVGGERPDTGGVCIRALVRLFRGYSTQVLEGSRCVSIHCCDCEVLKRERGKSTG